MIAKRLFSPTIAFAGAITLLAIPGSATMITGNALLQLGNGSVAVSGNGTTSGCIDWYNGGSPDGCVTPGTFTVGSGSTIPPFVLGTMGTIMDIPFNVVTPLSNFVAVDGISFDLAGIRRNGATAIGSCTSPSDTTSGASCTPAFSPFQLLNGLAGPSGVVNTLTIAFTVDLQGYVTGTKGSGFTNYVGIFTTQSPVNGNIDTVLNNINGGGSVTASWSGSFAPVSSVPEPASMFLLGAGLLGLGYLKKSKRSA